MKIARTAAIPRQQQLGAQMQTLRLSIIALILWSIGGLHAEESRPNILFLFTDDQPQNCVGIAGNKEIKTPHLDALAARGTYFNNAFVTTAICCSSRASILTGQTMARHGITDFKQPLSAAAFQQSYPALLRKAGYRTGYLGKYAIGNPGVHPRERCLPAQEFDEWYGFPQSINFKQTAPVMRSSVNKPERIANSPWATTWGTPTSGARSTPPMRKKC